MTRRAQSNQATLAARQQDAASGRCDFAAVEFQCRRNRRSTLRIFRGVLGKKPSGPKGRVRNFIANKELGTLSDIHENVISPGVTVPWHFHETEEVIIV